MKKLRNVTLEISGKPFLDDSEEMMRLVAERMFRQWRDLTCQAEQISVMLWISDGSEILNYSGNPDDLFEWACWQGCAEALPLPEPTYPRIERAFHYYPKKYREDAAPRSYRWLKRLIEVIREISLRHTGRNPRIIAIFDNGPEFCLSDFKYRLHPEICQGSTVWHNRSVVCNTRLHGDNRRYAAFPDGIPEGTPLGRFLGAQFARFAADLGYDAIWLSNGMGFGRDAWGISGNLFDEGQFHPERAEAARNSMLEFWEEFTAACPGMCIETRGSNYSAGVELSGDGAPLAELYHRFRIAPPVNSPWAALNCNTGLEIAAWMSHVAELPDERFPYRFYAHDPWFLNSPWLDRYGREPWDIYLPLTVSRIDGAGRTVTPDSVAILTIDDSWGGMPDQVPQEVIPHLLTALRSAPDAPGPFVWVYPFRRYCDMCRGSAPRLEAVFSEDLFLGEVLQAGFPLNTVVSAEHLAQVPVSSIAVMPVSAYGEPAEKFLAGGGRIIFYGALNDAPESLLKLLGLANGTPLSGRIPVTAAPDFDNFRHGGYAAEIWHHPVYNGGPLTEIGAGAEIIAAAGGRVLASICGRAAFLRTVLPQGRETAPGTVLTVPADQVYPVPALMRALAAKFGWTLEFSGFTGGSALPRLNISRHENVFFFAVFARDTTASIRIRTPLGIPLPDEMETECIGGCGLWHPGKCWFKRCRVLVEEPADTVLSLKLETHEEPLLEDKFSLSGLQDAVVRVFLPEEQLNRLEFVLGRAQDYLPAPRLSYVVEETELGPCAVLCGVTGCLWCGILAAEPAEPAKK